MKKFISGLIIGVMISITMVYAAASLTATPYAFPIFIKGVQYTDTANPAVTINNLVYMPVNAMGMAFGEKVAWNDTKKCLEIGIAQPQIIEVTNVVMKESFGMTTIEAEAKNYDKVKHSGFIRFAFYDEAGQLLGSASGAFNNLEPGQSKVFTAMASEDYTKVKNYKIQIDSLF